MEWEIVIHVVLDLTLKITIVSGLIILVSIVKKHRKQISELQKAIEALKPIKSPRVSIVPRVTDLR